MLTHKDLVQTRTWHRLGGDLEGELSFAVSGVDVPPSAAKSLCWEQPPEDFLLLPSSSSACRSSPVFIYAG